MTLQEQLDLKLQQRQARETGICPVREELYAQCFGECAPLCHQGARITKQRSGGMIAVHLDTHLYLTFVSDFCHAQMS